MSKRTITYSEMRSRRRCPYQGHLAYDELLTPKVKSPGLREGTIADQGMDALYLGVRDRGAYDEQTMLGAMYEAMAYDRKRIESSGPMMDEEWEKIDERYKLLRDVATRYVTYARENDPFDDIITMQYVGSAPVVAPSGHVSTKYDYRFKLDGLVVIDGALWLLENKWLKAIDDQTIRMLPLDEQCGMYMWGVRESLRRREASPVLQDAVERYGEPVGVFYNIIRKKLPVVPVQNKNGQTSQRKDIDTTAAGYRDTLAERGQDPADYAEILAILESKGDTFYHRESVLRNDRELDEIGQRIYESTRFISEDYRYKLPQKDCTWSCAYMPLCIEWSEELLEAQYTHKERRHEEYEREEA